MNPPHNIFAFEVDLTLYIFLAYGHFSLAEFADYVDSASLKCIPDQVVFIHHERTLKASELAVATEHLNARFRCKVDVFKFARNGQFEMEGPLNPLIGSFIWEGKETLIDLREPVLLPPPGKSFIKPSGAKESFFIQASNLFIRHAEMSFIALLLIREWGNLFGDNVRIIYVDTIDLYGLTSLASRMRFDDEQLGPITVSYSSYARYKEVLKHADVSNSLMAISATTSHSLLHEITVHTRWKEIDRAVTILDLDPKVHKGNTRIANPKVIAHVQPPDAQLHANHLPALRLAGEKFTIEADEPKSVVFKGLPHGRCLTHLKLSKLLELKDVFSAFGTVGGVTVPIVVDRNRLMEHEVFKGWLKAEIEKYAPASTSHVVLMDSDASQISPLLGIFGDAKPMVVTPQKLRSAELKIEGSVLVICPTFSRGSSLLEVSRDLRRQKGLKHVVYFTGIGTPESRSDFEKLRKNLDVSGFRVVSFCNVATGVPKTLALGWQSERELIRNHDSLNKVQELQSRAKALETGKLNDQNVFYQVDDLDLHEGFRYWEGLTYDHAKPPCLLMFITFAFLFQDARSNPQLSDEDRLSQLPNRRVLLDPENFFRYNDSLIQVCMLRAAFPVETDYSDHDSHSRSILYLFQRVEQVGNRALVYELLLAMATGRLRITADRLEELRKIVRASTMAECKWFATIPMFT